MLKLHHTQGRLEAGCDEAGRGCLAGAVFAASVILPPNFEHPLINDSKALSDKQRRLLREIIEQNAVEWAVASISPTEIDQMNILNASLKAINVAVQNLKVQPDFLLIDGNRFINETKIPFTCVVKGDATYISIAAASILAKTYRDDYMIQLDAEFPDYQWKKNKGYPTREHRNAIKECGITPYHRKSFNLIPAQLSLDLW